MSRREHGLFGTLWIGSGLLLIAALAMMVWYAPVDDAQGPIQKVFYIHLGAAIGTLVGAFGVLAGSVGYLWQRDLKWDRLADASARAAVLLLSVVLITGMIWAERVWGVWWEWNPPLTFSLALWVLYAAYLLVRRFARTRERRASWSASFGILASLDVPLVYLSVQFLPSSHLSAGERGPESQMTLLVWVAAVSLLTVCMIWTRYLLRDRADHGAAETVPDLLGAGSITAGGRA